MRSADPALLDPTPTSPLVVRAGGSMLVSTDALLAHLPELQALAAAVESDAQRLAQLSHGVEAGLLRTAIERSEHDGRLLAEQLRELRHGIATAELGYATAERAATWVRDVGAEWASGALGRLAAPLLPGLLASGWLAWQLAPGTPDEKSAALRAWLLDHPELVTSPGFCDLVRHIVTGADDAALGLAGAPPWLPVVLGDQGLGILGVDTSAGALIAVGTAGPGRLFHETPVRVDRVAETTGGSAPRGAEQRLARVPDDEQVRIERYDAPGEEARYIVYVAPTQTFSPMAEQEPWDLTSNVAGVAGLPAGSIRATEQAMADAGITADSEVVLVGFSQGGLVADAVAASGKWNTVGLETYGDPGGGIELPEGIRGVAVRHTDDFVVATGGPQGLTDRTVVERRAYPEGADIPHDLPAPAHQRRAYEQTARLLDAARSPELRGELDALDAFTGDYIRRDGASVTSYSYRAERMPVP